MTVHDGICQGGRIPDVSRVGRSTDPSHDRPAQKAPDQRKGTALHWVRVGSSICDQTVFFKFEIVADSDRPANRPADSDHF